MGGNTENSSQKILQSASVTDTLAMARDMFKRVFDNAPVALLILRGLEFHVEFVNDFYLQLVGKERDKFEDRPLWEGLPEVKNQGFDELLKGVYQTGIPYESKEHRVDVLKDGLMQPIFVNFIYQAIRDLKGDVNGIAVIATEVTDHVLSRKKAEVGEEHFRSLVVNAPMATALYVGRDMIIELANEKMIRLWGKDESVINKKLADALPELEGQPFLQLLDDVFSSGVPYEANEDAVDLVVDGKLQTFYFKFTYKPLKNSEGNIYAILNMAVDITDQVIAKRKLAENEELLSFALDSAEMGTFDLDPVNMVFRSSKRLKQLFGLPDEEEINLERAINAIHIRDRQKVADAIQWALNPQSDGVYDIEYSVISLRDGKERVIRAKGKSYFDQNGDAYRLGGTVQDVTSQVEILRRIEESEQRLNMAMDFTNTGSFDLDLGNGNLIYTSRLGEIFGYDSSIRVSHSTLKKHVHHEDMPIVEAAFQKALRTGIYEYQVRIVKEGNVENWIATNARVLYDAERRPSRMIGTIRDITESKTEQLRKDEFMGIVTHELKTPVTSLKAFAQFLNLRFQKSGDEASASFLSKMETQINKLNLLIQDLLDVTKIEGGKLQFFETHFVMNDLVNEVVEDLQRTTEKKIVIEELSGKIELVADKDRTGQILINLLSNAIKYSPDADQVVISTKLENKIMKCCVKDYGIGISKEQQKRLFERFYRVNSNNADTFPGLGLGLYISSEIASRQNGKIVVESKHGEGSTFCLHLPTNV